MIQETFSRLGMTGMFKCPSTGLYLLFLTASIVFAGFPGDLASALEPVEIDSSSALATAFEVHNGAEMNVITVSEIEELDLYRVTTTSPWEKGEMTFEGALFRDVLKKMGLADVDAVLVRAEDNYTQTIPREDWTDGPLLLATRQDGVPLTGRTQGPTRLVYPLLDNPEYDSELHKPRWVWTIASIEPAVPES